MLVFQPYLLWQLCYGNKKRSRTHFLWQFSLSKNKVSRFNFLSCHGQPWWGNGLWSVWANHSRKGHEGLCIPIFICSASVYMPIITITFHVHCSSWNSPAAGRSIISSVIISQSPTHPRPIVHQKYILKFTWTHRPVRNIGTSITSSAATVEWESEETAKWGKFSVFWDTFITLWETLGNFG